MLGRRVRSVLRTSAAGTLLVTVLLSLPTVPLVHPIAPASPPSTPGTDRPGGGPLVQGAPVPETRAPRPSTSLSSEFWGVNVRPLDPWNATLTRDLSRTGSQLVRWPGGGYTDRYDPLANHGLGVIYNDDGSTSTPQLSTLSFLSMAENLSLRVIFSLPAEINSTSQVKAEVAYVGTTLGFHPYAWEIGNEPALWTHFNTPWTSWTTSQDRGPTFAQYTQVVEGDVRAIRSIDRSTPVIGLGGVGTGSTSETDWINATLAAPGVNAVAIHVYPDGSGYNGESLTGFFSGLDSSSSLFWRVPRDEQAIAASCPGCGISLLVGEYGAAEGTTLAAYMSGFPMVPFVSAEVVQAVAVGEPSMVYWDFQGDYPGSWFPPSYTPVHTIYQAFSSVYPTLPPGNLSVGPSTSVGLGEYTLLSSNASALSLLVVNANATRSLVLNLSQEGLQVLSGPGTSLTWNASSATPLLRSYPTHLPFTWRMPSESIAVLQVQSSSPPPGPLAVTGTAFPISGVVPLSVALSSTASGGASPYSVAWSFGDGSPGSASWAPSHVYNSSGSFSAVVQVRDALGHVASRSLPIQVLGPAGQLLPVESASPTVGPAPLQVNLAGSATGGRPPYLYNWSLGDLSPNALSQNVTHAFSAPGIYVVTLEVTDSAGSESATSTQVHVNPAVFAQVLANRTRGVAPLSVAFTGSAGGGVPPYSYAWSFGDATSGTGVTVVHTFAQSRTYTVNLTVQDSLGETGTQSVGITVGPPLSSLAVQLQAPLELSPGTQGSFTALPSGGTSPYAFLWNFGDGSGSGSTATGSTVHTYANAGNYVVTVTVQDSGGRLSSASAAVQVSASPWSILTGPVLGVPWPILLMGVFLLALVVVLSVRRLRTKGGRRRAGNHRAAGKDASKEVERLPVSRTGPSSPGRAPDNRFYRNPPHR
ncbi:MAG: PKD domain-containing protein [Euryarchaeota archaeon]|nr:PKD domain-containing protein [Euryarchaeota archaeon]